MSKFSMKELLAQSEEKYADFEFTVPVRDKKGNEVTDENGELVTKDAAFRYYLRVELKQRQKLARAYRYLTGEEDITKDLPEDADMVTGLVKFLSDTLEGLAVTPADARLVRKELGEDLILWSLFFDAYEKAYDMQEDESGE